MLDSENVEPRKGSPDKLNEEAVMAELENKFEQPPLSPNKRTRISAGDDEYLKSLGYKSELYRGFNAFMSFTMVFTSVGVICSNALIFDYGLNTGGPVMLTWGWIVGSFFTYLIARSLAEITSTYPVSGSTYHWAGLLAKREYAGISSFICGWFSFLGNAACDASYAYGFA